MNLKKVLNRLDVYELREYMKQLRVSLPLSMEYDEKEALTIALSNYLLRPSVMMARLSVLTDYDFALFLAAMKEPVDLSPDQLPHGLRLCDLDYSAIDDNGCLCVPDDVALVYSSINQEDYQTLRSQASRMRRILNVVCAFYGAVPPWVLQEIYNEAFDARLSVDEAKELFLYIPADLNPCVMVDGKICDRFLAMEPDVHEQLMEQKDELFYILTRDDFTDFVENGYLAESKAYRELLYFFSRKIDPLAAIKATSEVYLALASGDEFEYLLAWLHDWGIHLASDIELKQLIRLMLDAYGNTRLIKYQGHTLREMAAFCGEADPTRRPALIAHSKEMADALQQHQAALARMGFEVDYTCLATDVSSMACPQGIEGPSLLTTRRIYPKDSCLCHSGKQYQFCCGLEKFTMRVENEESKQDTEK